MSLALRERISLPRRKTMYEEVAGDSVDPEGEDKAES